MQLDTLAHCRSLDHLQNGDAASVVSARPGFGGNFQLPLVSYLHETHLALTSWSCRNQMLSSSHKDGHLNLLLARKPQKRTNGNGRRWPTRLQPKNERPSFSDCVPSFATLFGGRHQTYTHG